MMTTNFKKIPKVELHLHLDGSVPISVLENHYKKDIKEEVIAKDKCNDLSDYLTKFSLPVSFLQNKEHLEDTCYMLSKELENDGVIYAEVRFSPIKLAAILSLEEVIDTVIAGFKKGNVKVNLILCMMRNDSFETNIEVIKLAKKYFGKGVVAIDLAGDEKNYPTENFKELFSIIHSYKIPYTIHAGEVGDLKSLQNAISYNTTRLGHGISCIYDIDILHEIVDKKILLEICPTSNVQTNIVSNYQEHPILKLKEAGCKICINTDNRTVSNISLTEEYEKLINNFGFTVKDFYEFNVNAINYSFMSQSEKEEMMKILSDEYSKL